METVRLVEVPAGDWAAVITERERESHPPRVSVEAIARMTCDTREGVEEAAEAWHPSRNARRSM